MTTVKCSSAFQAEPGDYLTASMDLADWIASLPDAAHLSAIQTDHGSQRDPVVVTTGLRATWEEIR